MNSGDYYRPLQAVRDSKGATDAWEAWLLDMIRGVSKAAQGTLALIEGMRALIADYSSAFAPSTRKSIRRTC